MKLIILAITGILMLIAIVPATASTQNTYEFKVITQGSQFVVSLPENPTTGYQWDVSLSHGLKLVSDNFQTNPQPADMVGVGGTHTWNILAKDMGFQKVSAIYRRSWEPVTGKEKTYTMYLKVTRSKPVVKAISYHNLHNLY